MMKSRMALCWITTAVLCCSVLALGSAKQHPEDDFGPIAQSDAYREFLNKPKTNISRGICILNYYRNTPISIQYDGVDYPALVAYPVGLAYMMAHYKNEDPKQWIKKHCYRTITKNNIIYFKFPSGRTRPARDVLLEKLNELDCAIKKKS